jgi:hypothetical protein
MVIKSTKIRNYKKQPYRTLHTNTHTHTHTTESANVKVHNIFYGRNNITCSTNCNNRTAATLYMYPRNIFCLRYNIIVRVNTLHKADNKDNNNNNNNIYYYVVVFSCHRPILLGTSPLESAVIPTTQSSSFRLQYFPYYV